MNMDRTTNKKIDISHAVPKKVESRKKTSTLLSKKDLQKIEKNRKEEIIFSWKFFDRQHPFFNMGKCEAGWFISLIDGLKSVSRDRKSTRLNSSHVAISYA